MLQSPQRDLLETARVLEALAEAQTLEEARAAMVTLAQPEAITYEEAAQRFGVPASTLRRWTSRGHLKRLGRIPHTMGRGGGKVLIDAAQVAHLKAHPPKNGRPFRNHEQSP